MQITTTHRPAQEAAEHISSLITEASSDVLILLSGGSALNVFEFIKIPDASECRIIFIMVDERVSGAEDTNNYLQLKALYGDQTNFESVLNTSAAENETPETFAQRIKEIFLKKFFELNEPKVIALLGVGPDGHTAGIFPLDEESFTKTYEADSTYVPVQAESLTIDSRASFTPSWILNNCDVVIGYMTGKSKKTMLKSLKNETKAVHERPAEILKLHKDAVIYTDVSL